jgi:membrane-bound lytic murein transglycosylase B
MGLPVPTTRARARLAWAAPMIPLALWLLALPFRILFALGLRRTVALGCVLVLAVTAYGVAQDLGLLQPPAHAAPARTPARNPAPGQPAPTRTATADIPAGYLRLYRAAGARYQVPWPVLAAIGKLESDHGRSRLPGVRSGSNWAGACGPMQIGCVPGSKAGNSWARYGHGRPHNPAAAIPAAARYLVAHGARHHLDRALYAYNHSRTYVAKVKQLARRYATRGGGRP